VGNPTTEPEIDLLKVQWRMPHVILNKVNKLSLLRAWAIFKYEFPLMGSVRVPPVVEHNQTFMGRQDCDSAGETAIRYLCSAHWLKEYHVSKCQCVRRL